MGTAEPTALPGTLAHEARGPPGFEHLSTKRHPSTAGADASPVHVDSVVFNLCPAWGFCRMWGVGPRGVGGDWEAENQCVLGIPFRVSYHRVINELRIRHPCLFFPRRVAEHNSPVELRKTRVERAGGPFRVAAAPRSDVAHSLPFRLPMSLSPSGCAAAGVDIGLTGLSTVLSLMIFGFPRLARFNLFSLSLGPICLPHALAMTSSLYVGGSPNLSFLHVY